MLRFELRTASMVYKSSAQPFVHLGTLKYYGYPISEVAFSLWFCLLCDLMS